MNIGDPVDPRLPWIKRLDLLEAARALSIPSQQLQALRQAGRRLGDGLREQPCVLGVKTLDNATLPYPTRFAFNGAVPLPWPMVMLQHRTLLVRLNTEAGEKHLLFNPTDVDAARHTPFFAKLAARVQRIAPFAEKLLSKRFAPLAQQLADVGLTPADIDVIAFDHFHTQDLRPLLGTAAGEGAYPNALLLASRREWQDWDGLHPMQRAWFIAEGKSGVPAERVVLTDHDLALGEGCALIRTPGHTSGNQTLFVHGHEGIFGCSENGTSSDNWSPRSSTIVGVRRFAEYYDIEVVLNANTPERGADQYTSMVLERSIVDSVPTRPELVQMFPSSEVMPSPLAPGIKPAIVFGHRDSGCFAG